MITLRRNNVVKVVDSEEKAAKLVKDGFEMIEDENTETKIDFICTAAGQSVCLCRAERVWYGNRQDDRSGSR